MHHPFNEFPLIRLPEEVIGIRHQIPFQGFRIDPQGARVALAPAQVDEQFTVDAQLLRVADRDSLDAPPFRNCHRDQHPRCSFRKVVQDLHVREPDRKAVFSDFHGAGYSHHPSGQIECPAGSQRAARFERIGHGFERGPAGNNHIQLRRAGHGVRRPENPVHTREKKQKDRCQSRLPGMSLQIFHSLGGSDHLFFVDVARWIIRILSTALDSSIMRSKRRRMA